MNEQTDSSDPSSLSNPCSYPDLREKIEFRVSMRLQHPRKFCIRNV